ncbi:hypothetical protein L3X38_013431 [Prunus dulcis]|uniref:Uncharacterized protein n=1 Tax=Prunus dulcis TaxID=3755 RepID=A0AAD4WLH3_PRUDU|nr:hypothetical protein L3X38_013431 [Prunus dulcis]
MNGSLVKLMATPTHSKYPTPMDPNPTPNPTLAITEGGDTEHLPKQQQKTLKTGSMDCSNVEPIPCSGKISMQTYAVIAFKESDEMAQLKQQQLESGFELFRKFAQIVDAEGKWDITVGGVMNLMGRGRCI